MLWRGVGLTVLTVLTGVISGCANTGVPAEMSAPADDQHNNMNSVLWIQTGAEYQGNSIQTFQAAIDSLPRLMRSTGVTADLDQATAHNCQAGEPCQSLAAADLKPAVVLDVDETVLDNSPYQARLVRDGRSFSPATWDQWVAEKSALAVPGAVAFIEAATKQGFAVVYITNRSCAARPGNPDVCPQKTDTAANLISAGFPAPAEYDRLILRGEKPEWDMSEKQSRRQAIAEQYRIVMLLGDDLGDLASNIKAGSVTDRAAFVDEHAALYGRVWFQLANPTYGSWQRALGDTPTEYLRTD